MSTRLPRPCTSVRPIAAAAGLRSSPSLTSARALPTRGLFSAAFQRAGPALPGPDFGSAPRAPDLFARLAKGPWGGRPPLAQRSGRRPWPRALGSPIAPLALSCPAPPRPPRLVFRLFPASLLELRKKSADTLAVFLNSDIETMAFADSYPNHYTLGALAATLTWLLGGTPTASAVIGVGFGYAAKTLYAPGSVSMATAGMRPAGR
eukprot:tig00020851_g14716.t1